MVIQRAVDNLKEKPKEDRTAVAGGIAIMVVVILLVAWGFYFIKKIQQSPPLEFGGTAQDEFNFSTVREAQKQIQESFQYTEEELRTIRESAAERGAPQNVEGFAPVDGGGQFGTPTE